MSSGIGSLLGWATENTVTDKNDPNYVPPKPLEHLDPGIIDMILGKPDAVRMKEALGIAVDESQSEDARVQALDELEMLIESLDNANDMEVLKMWDPMLALTTSSSPEIATQSLWVIGTAIQNNSKSQAAFLGHDPFPRIISALSASQSADVRSKAMYCLSGALKHNRTAMEQFTRAEGWIAMKASLSDSSIAVRRKAAFLLNTLLVSEKSTEHSSVVPASMNTSDLTRAALSFNYIISALTSSVVSPAPVGTDGSVVHDIDYEEKAMRTVVTYFEGEAVGTEIDDDPGASAKEDLTKLLEEKDTERGRGWGLDEKDWAVLRNHAAIAE